MTMIVSSHLISTISTFFLNSKLCFSLFHSFIPALNQKVVHISTLLASVRFQTGSFNSLGVDVAFFLTYEGPSSFES